MNELEDRYEKQLDLLQGGIDYNFISRELLDQALTSKGFSNENENCPFRDSLSLIGDEIHKIYWIQEGIQLGLSEKGELSKYRDQWINHEAQAEEIRDLFLEMNINSEYLFRMSKGELRNEIFNEERFLETFFEALIGAVYLDSNFDKTMDIIKNIYL